MKKPFTKDICQEIIKMVEWDLAIREELDHKGELQKYGYHPVMEQVHVKNSQRLEEIIGLHGFPTLNQVGIDVHQAAWLIVQHAISNLKFMCYCYDLFLTLSHEEISVQNIAYLGDRIAFYKRRPQKYGTQFDYELTGEFGVWWLENKPYVNEYRAQVGLPPLEVNPLYVNPLDSVSKEEANKMRSEQEAWLIATGWCSQEDIDDCLKEYGS